MKKFKLEPKLLLIPIRIILCIALIISIYNNNVTYTEATGTVIIDGEDRSVFFGIRASIPVDMPLPEKYTFNDKDKVTCRIKQVRAIVGDTISYKIISVEKINE